MTTAPRVAAAEHIAESSDMSKQVRWQVPFAAHDGTRYRVDIYDEGYTGNPVVLTAGEAKRISPDANGIGELIHELISDHTLG